MRCAVIVAPWDPRSSDAGTWSEAVAWLGAALGRLGFRVSVVDGGHDIEGQLAAALADVSADDDVLVHVSGHLARRGVLRVADGRWLPLRALGDTLAANETANVSLFAELVHEDDADDALVAADHVASTVAALGARERGYGVIAAVRPASAAIEGLAFTRLVLYVAEAARRGCRPATSAPSMCEPANCSGHSTQFLTQENLARTPGRRTLGKAAAAPTIGPACPWIPSAASFTFPPVPRHSIFMAAIASATISLRIL